MLRFVLVLHMLHPQEHPEWIHLGVLFLLPWLTYLELLIHPTAFQIDDLDGVKNFNGVLQKPLRWHHLFRWLRWHLGRIPNPDQLWEQKKQPKYHQSSKAHHRFSVWMLSGVLLGLYGFLTPLVGAQTAFLATALFGVHPITAQVTAWMSGIGYLTGVFFTLIGLNFVLLTQTWPQSPYLIILSFLIYAFLQWMAVEAMFVTVGSFLILLYLKQWPFAAIAGAIAIYGCLNTFREAVTLRVSTFKSQQMGKTTKFYPRKLIFVIRLLAYNVRLALWPKRMGLYHTFGYHYTQPYVETEDGYFWAGIALIIGAIAAWLSGIFIIQLAILFWIAYTTMFGGWIIANQVVADRYVWLGTIGICLLAAAYLPLWLFCLFLGIALMRTWAHIPTYFTEMGYYLSNLWNFPKSEVAMGNLGVVYINQGMIGSAVEAWATGIRMNPHYDVNYYNLANIFRSRGFPNPYYLPLILGTPESVIPVEVVQKAMKSPQTAHLQCARYLLDKALNTATCHFPENWKKELSELDRQLMTIVGNIVMPRYQAPLSPIPVT